MIEILGVVVSVFFVLMQVQGRQQDIDQLSLGLDQIPQEGCPGSIVAFGSNAVVPAFVQDEASPVGMAIFGAGRVVALGHNGYFHHLTPQEGVHVQTRQLMRNALLWAANAMCEKDACQDYCDLSGAKGRKYAMKSDCRLPIRVSGIGISKELLNSIVSSLSENGLVEAAAAETSPTQQAFRTVLDSQPDVVLWTNTDCSKEMTLTPDRLDSRATALLNFVRQGGGVITAVCPWGWQMLSKKEGALESSCLFNHFLEAVGLSMTAKIIGSSNSLVLQPDHEPGLNPGRTLENTLSTIKSGRTSLNVSELRDTVKAISEMIPSSVMSSSRIGYTRFITADSDLRTQLQDLIPYIVDIGKPNTEFPMSLAQHVQNGAADLPQSAAYLYIAWLRKHSESTCPHECESAAPLTSPFPGNVQEPHQRASNFKFTINPHLKRWQHTGIYAPAGEVVTITIDRHFLSEGLEFVVQIGCHQDELPVFSMDGATEYKLERHPQLIFRRPWNPAEAGLPDKLPFHSASGPEVRESIACASPYGGPLYVEILQPPKTNAYVHIPFVIEEGVPILYYNLEKELGLIPVSPGAESYPHARLPWMERKLQFIAAPWGELEGRFIILSVPTESLRLIDDPTRVLDYWDNVVSHELALSGDKLDHKERLVADRQITAGSMHSGYPIMAQLDVYKVTQKGLPALLDVDYLLSLKDYSAGWGMYHELGHNRQKDYWTWDGCGEVSVNIFSLYCTQMVHHLSPFNAPYYIDNCKDKATKYLTSSQTYNDWTKDPNIALSTYVYLIEEIGWKALADTFRAYEALQDKPSDNVKKITEWVLQTSIASKQDLTSFYEQWKWPFDKNILQSRMPSLPKYTKRLG